MKWTNTIKNFKTLKTDILLTISSPILTVVDILKIIPLGIRDIQENAKNIEITGVVTKTTVKSKT